MDYDNARGLTVSARPTMPTLATSRVTTPVSAPPAKGVVAIYARYSTSKQKFVSIERQVEDCRDYAERNGLRVHKVYTDEAVSGMVVSRLGLQDMVADARDGLFEAVLVEHVDRLARDLGLAVTVFKKLRRCGVSTHVPGQGALTLSLLALLGLMGDEARTQLITRTRFSINDMAREGRFPTGPCFGYVKVLGQPGVCAKDPFAAAAVLRMFQLRADGLSHLAISRILNAEGVRNEKGRGLSSTSIKGFLANERYVGLLVFNRHLCTKDNDTGLRTVRLRPRSEWIVTEVPSARIVDQDLWDRVRAIEVQRRNGSPGVRTSDERARELLSGRVVCPGCGGNMHVKSASEVKRAWHCADATVHSACGNHRYFSVAGLNKLVLQLIADELERPEYIEAYVSAYNEERLQAEAKHHDQRAARQRRVDALALRWDRAFDEALTDGFVSPRVVSRRKEIEAELAEAERELAELPVRAFPISVDVGKMTALQDAVGTLASCSRIGSADEATLRVVATIREIVSRVDVKSVAPGRFNVSVTLRLGRMLQGGTPGDPAPAGTRVLTGSCQVGRGGYRTSRESLDYEARYAAGHPYVTDGDWEAVRHLLPAIASTMWSKVKYDPRDTIEAMVMVLMTGTTWTRLPTRFGKYQAVQYRAAQIWSTPEWKTFAAGLAFRDPGRFGRLPALSRHYEEWAARYRLSHRRVRSTAAKLRAAKQTV